VTFYCEAFEIQSKLCQIYFLYCHSLESKDFIMVDNLTFYALHINKLSRCHYFFKHLQSICAKLNMTAS